jgi:hypothetical protein
MSIGEQIERLAALATGLCQDTDIRLEVTPTPTWAWDAIRRVLIVSGPDLESKGAEFCAGVLAHEVGHFYVSRYLWFSVPFPSPPILRFLLNAIEDPRVNTWIRRRYPGCNPWMDRVADIDMRIVSTEPKPKLVTFGLEAAREEWLRWTPLPDGLVHPDVERALDETRVARREFAETLPPASLDPDFFGPDLTRRYREEVWPRLSPRAHRVLPSPREQGVRLSVLQSLRIAEERILPVALRLLEDDIERIAEYLRDNAEAQKKADEALHSDDGEKVREIAREAAEHEAEAGAADPRIELRAMSLSLMEALLENMNRRDRRSPLGEGEDECDGMPRFRPTRSGSKRKGRLRLSRRPGRGKPSGHSLKAAEGKWPEGSETEPGTPVITGYDNILNKVVRQVQQLAKVIEDELRPVKRLGERKGYPSGYKLDLRRLMRYHADFKDYDKLWLRKTVPDRWSVVFSLLVDLSGSMQGEKAEAAVAGAVLLAETLHRINVPFLINGFQDKLIPFCPIGEGLTPRVRSTLAEMPQEVAGCRPRGNNQPSYNDDGPCLIEAAEEVLALGYDERLLVVISDGIPEGCRSTPDDLRRAVADLRGLEPGLKLVAIGLGQGTEHVNEFYPEAKANVPVDRLAAEIGELLRKKLRVDRRRGAEPV